MHVQQKGRQRLTHLYQSQLIVYLSIDRSYSLNEQTPAFPPSFSLSLTGRASDSCFHHWLVAGNTRKVQSLSLPIRLLTQLTWRDSFNQLGFLLLVRSTVNKLGQLHKLLLLRTADCTHIVVAHHPQLSFPHQS